MAGEVESGAQIDVHLEEIVREDRGFGAAGARVDFEEAREGSEGVRWDQRGFKGIRESREGGQGGLDVAFCKRSKLRICGRVGEH